MRFIAAREEIPGHTAQARSWPAQQHAAANSVDVVLRIESVAAGAHISGRGDNRVPDFTFDSSGP